MAYLTQVDVGGHPVNGSELVRQNGRIVGVRLGDIAADSLLDIDVCYTLPDGLLVLPGQEPALRVEVFRASSTNDEEK